MAPDPIALARAAEEALAWPDRYGGHLVYFIQRQDRDLLKIGTTRNLTARLQTMLNASMEPIVVRAIVPGGQPLECWFQRRHRTAGRHHLNEWFADADAIVADAEAFLATQRREYVVSRDLCAATVAALQADPEIIDLERLYRNGMTQVAIADLWGVKPSQVRSRLAHLRALGVDLKYRRGYARRARGDRFERPTPELGRTRVFG